MKRNKKIKTGKIRKIIIFNTILENQFEFIINDNYPTIQKRFLNKIFIFLVAWNRKICKKKNKNVISLSEFLNLIDKRDT